MSLGVNVNLLFPRRRSLSMKMGASGHTKGSDLKKVVILSFFLGVLICIQKFSAHNFFRKFFFFDFSKKTEIHDFFP